MEPFAKQKRNRLMDTENKLLAVRLGRSWVAGKTGDGIKRYNFPVIKK